MHFEGTSCFSACVFFYFEAPKPEICFPVANFSIVLNKIRDNKDLCVFFYWLGCHTSLVFNRTHGAQFVETIKEFKPPYKLCRVGHRQGATLHRETEAAPSSSVVPSFSGASLPPLSAGEPSAVPTVRYYSCFLRFLRWLWHKTCWICSPRVQPA